MDIKVIVLFGMTGLFFIFWLIVYFKGQERLVSKVFNIFVINMALWAFGLAMFYKSADLKVALFWTNVLYIAGSLIPAAFLLLSFVFPTGEFTISKFRQFLIFVPNAVILLLFFFTPIIIKEVTVINGVKGFIYGPGHIFWDLQFDIIFVWAFLRFIRMYKHSLGVTKVRLRYLVLGTLIGVILAGSTNVIMPWFNRFELLWLGPPLTLTWLIAVTYAIIKYRLMDITILAVRTLIFIIVYGTLLILPLFTLFAPKSVIDRISIGLYAFLSSSAPFIYLFLQRRAEDILLKEQRHYQEILTNLSKSMINIRNLDELLKTVTSTVSVAVKIKFAAMYLMEEEYKSYQLKSCYPVVIKTQLSEFIPLNTPFIYTLKQEKKPLLNEEIGSQDKIKADVGLILPCFGKDGLLGFIVLGAKEKNQMYTPDELPVFENLGYSTSLAIENCRFWREIEDRQRKARLQEMDTYSYSLAHEIDNPIQSIIYSNTYLKDFILKDIALPIDKEKEIKDACEATIQASRRVSAMVKAIKEFGEPITGSPKPLKVEEIIESFLKLYSPQFKHNGISFSQELPKEPLFVRGEKPELMQVLVILSDNSIHALQATKEKRISLKVEIPNQDFARIIFSDNGYGIKKELIPIIFSPFTTTKASSEGTGMGLHNAKKIISKYNGRLWAESEGENKGACFYVELPIAKDVTEEELKKEDKGKRLF